MYTYSITHNNLDVSVLIQGNSIAQAFANAGINRTEWKINYIECTR